MTGNSPFTADEISRELKLGIATTKFILKRFAQFFPSQPILGQYSYSPNLIPLVVQIKDHMDQGMLPSQIEDSMNAGSQDQTLYGQTDMQSGSDLLGISSDRDTNGDIRISQDGLSAIQSLFNDIKSHQDRVAMAHEQRAKAEERKAVAIEKRAEAEEKKALAMDNIAAALQEMNRQRANDIQEREIARHTARAITLDEIPGNGIQSDEISNGELPQEVKTQEDEKSRTDDIERPKTVPDHQDLSCDNSDLTFQDPGLDNLSDLICAPPLPEEQDLSKSLKPAIEKEDADRRDALDLDNLEDLLDQPDSPGQDPLLDDLSALLDTENTDTDIDRKGQGTPSLAHTDMDDLSQLLDKELQRQVLNTDNQDMDDLSLLIEKSLPEINPARTDNLSLLLEPASENIRQEINKLGQDSSPSDSMEMDNLAALIQDESPTDSRPTELDNLSSLLDQPVTKADPQTITNGKGSSDVENTENPNEGTRSLKPDISPEDNLNAYKAEVMKIIIQLKSEGLSAKETTARLNLDRVLTLSGKPSWSEKALAKIYGFIDSAS